MSSILKCSNGSIVKCSSGEIRLVESVCPLLGIYSVGDWPTDGLIRNLIVGDTVATVGSNETQIYLEHEDSIPRDLDWQEIDEARTIIYGSGGEIEITLTPTSGTLATPSGTQNLTFGVNIKTAPSSADAGSTPVQIDFQDVHGCCAKMSVIMNMNIIARYTSSLLLTHPQSWYAGNDPHTVAAATYYGDPGFYWAWYRAIGGRSYELKHYVKTGVWTSTAADWSNPFGHGTIKQVYPSFKTNGQFQAVHTFTGYNGVTNTVTWYHPSWGA